MKKYIRILAIAATALSMTACGYAVEVPPAHVAKILGKNGFAPDTVTPSKFRLPMCLQYCDNLVLLEAADTAFAESLQIFMPEDKLNIVVDIRGTLSVPSEEQTVNQLFDRITSTKAVNKRVSIITSHTVYEIYGKQALRGIVRSELTKHSIADILANRSTISTGIHAAIIAKLKETKTPLRVSRFELANVQPPKVIVEAQEAAKEREIDIQKAEADAQVALVTAEKDLEIAKKERLVDRERAMAIAEQNEIAAESITPQLLAYRKLETAERVYAALAKSSNTIIIPADSSSFSSINDEVVLAKMLEKSFKPTK